jgi:hypothetical protein
MLWDTIIIEDCNCSFLRDGKMANGSWCARLVAYFLHPSLQPSDLHRQRTQVLASNSTSTSENQFSMCHMHASSPCHSENACCPTSWRPPGCYPSERDRMNCLKVSSMLFRSSIRLLACILSWQRKPKFRKMYPWTRLMDLQLARTLPYLRPPSQETKLKTMAMNFAPRNCCFDPLIGPLYA